MLDYRVSFNTKHAVFPPNSQVTATVYLQTDKVLKARKIDINIMGVAKTSWEEYYTTYDCDGNPYTEVIYYGSKIFYINAYSILWKSPDGKNLLQPGKYQFPLTFVIPANAPPSMSGTYGHISYRVRTNIDIPWAPDEERFCEFSVSMNKTGYVPGENIALKIRIDNETSWKVTKFEIGIVESLFYTGHRQSYMYYSGFEYGYPYSMNKYSSHVVTSKYVIVDSIVDESKTFYLTVPPLSPSYHECPIITNNYSLFVKVCTDAVFSSGPGIQLPITIGSIAIREPPPTATNVIKTVQTTPGETKIRQSSTIKSTENTKNTAEKDDEEVAVSPKVQDDGKKKISNINA
uniref:Arrestin C-terminal-like domain-containing protein n=1 Tax=Panagrolaimus sp. ES5 TaxID=591445 RepID=A0AC34FAU7_9BILA